MAMKKVDSFLKEYAAKLSEDNLKFLNARLSQRLSGDLAEAVNFLAGTSDMDHWLESAKSSWEFYDMLDSLHNYVEKEAIKRWGEAA